MFGLTNNGAESRIGSPAESRPLVKAAGGTRAHMHAREQELRRRRAEAKALRRDRDRYREMAIRLTDARVAREAPYLLRDLVAADCPELLQEPPIQVVQDEPAPRKSWWRRSAG